MITTHQPNMPLILAVDDEANNLQLLRHILQDHYRLLYAKDGTRALELARQELPQLILLDVMMPGMTGYDVCRKLRQDERTRDTPVIFLTAKGMLMDMAEGEDAGSDLYLIKPVLATKLLNMVAMFLSDDTPLAKKRRKGTPAAG